MKRFFVVFFALTLALSCLSACSLKPVEKVDNILKQQNRPVATQSEEKPVVEAVTAAPALEEVGDALRETEAVLTPEEAAPAMDMSAPINELYALELTDAYNGFATSYYVPQINCESNDAQQINEAIKEDYGAIVEKELASYEEGASFTCEFIKWQLIPSGEYTFALIVSCGYPGGNIYYSVYNFDGMSGEKIGNEEILDQFQLTEEQFLDLTRAAAEDYYVGAYGAFAEMDDYYYQNRLEFTISDEQIRTDLPVFINENGGLSVIALIGSLAGADAYYHIIEICN